MKANELRIMNYVSIEDIDKQEPVEVNGISQGFNDEPYDIEIKFKDAMYSSIPIEEINPIPLTQEWLDKFGFKSRGSNRVFTNGSYGVDLGITIFFVQLGIDNNMDAFFRTPIKYVHQLQNLYFALTQKELS